MHAALISREFCDLLLTNPAAALASGCNGESFSLSPGEQELVLSIRASSLADFAQQLTGCNDLRRIATASGRKRNALADVAPPN